MAVPQFMAKRGQSAPQVHLSMPFWRVEWSGAISYADGTAYASMVDSSAAIIAAVAYAKTLGVPVLGCGTFRVDATIAIDIDCDFTGATFVCSDTALTLVRAGTSTASAVVRRKKMILPKVQNAVKTGTGWTGASIGIELANLHESKIEIPYAQSFTDGVRLATYGTMGTAHNHIWLGHLDNNKRNIVLAPGASTGWANQNTFYDGRCSHDSAEGAAASGTRHVLLQGGSAIQPNANRWFGTSFESPLTPTSVVEYMVESIAGIYNRFYDCRWEVAGSAVPKVYWNQFDATYYSRDNTIHEGYNAAAIVFTVSANSARNRLESETRNAIYGASTTVPAIALQNTTSDAGPVYLVYDSTTDPLIAGTTDWIAKLSANTYEGKAKADTQPRIRINNKTGVVDLGAGGSTAPSVSFSILGADIWGSVDSFIAPERVTAKATTATLASSEQIATGDATSAAFTINLPTAVGISGRIYTVKKIDASANAVTVDPSGSETIDGAATKALGSQWAFIRVASNGANWLIVAQGGTVT